MSEMLEVAILRDMEALRETKKKNTTTEKKMTIHLAVNWEQPWISTDRDS